MPEGLFVDQRWVDLVPALFDDYVVMKRAGLNVAYWNLHERSIELDGPRLSLIKLEDGAANWDIAKDTAAAATNRDLSVHGVPNQNARANNRPMIAYATSTSDALRIVTASRTAGSGTSAAYSRAISRST